MLLIVSTVFVMTLHTASSTDTSGAFGSVSAGDYPTIQAAMDAHPGGVVVVPPGRHEISEPLRISSDGTVLMGFGVIVQVNPAAAILEIRGVKGVRVRDLTLTRRLDGVDGAERPGLDAEECVGLELDGLKVLGNKSTASSVRLDRCSHSRVRNCDISDYKRIGIDDRTENSPYGYAFKVIDGSGIVVTRGRAIVIDGNRVVELNLLPSPELKAAHGLGQLVEGKRPTHKGPLAPKGDYANNWHQGSAIVVTDPESSDFIQVTNNYIENAAQGIDLHADHVICSHNLINGAFIGVKTMHGSRNVLISDNNLSRIDLWGICLQPGTASHRAKPATKETAAVAANLTAGIVIANNVFSDFGRGLDHFNWVDAGSHVVSLQWGPFEENPPLTDVVVIGNIAYDTESEAPDADGAKVSPRYDYAVFLDQRLDRTRFTFKGNLFHSGAKGTANFPLAPD